MYFYAVNASFIEIKLSEQFRSNDFNDNTSKYYLDIRIRVNTWS